MMFHFSETYLVWEITLSIDLKGFFVVVIFFEIEHLAQEFSS